MKRILGFCLAAGVLLDVALWAQEGVTFTRISEGPLVTDTEWFLGASWGDYDNDGYLDVVLRPLGSNKTSYLYHNDGGDAFSRVTEGIVSTDPGFPLGAAWGDYDNDGDLDLYTTHQTGPKNCFYRNLGGGDFEKLSGPWLDWVGGSTTPAWGDYDNDGYLDLYVANAGPQVNFFFQNNGDGTMTRIYNATTGISAYSHSCIWSDLDDSGTLDLLVCGQDPVVYLNNGDSSFTGKPYNDGGLPSSGQQDQGLSVGDFDNDGDMDALKTFFAQQNPPIASRLYENDGTGQFEEVIDGFPTPPNGQGMGSAFGDYDNDGDLDIYISLGGNQNNLLYRNDGTGSFTRVVDSPLVEVGFGSTACAWVDYDNDGDLDLFAATWTDGESSNLLYRNEGNENNWIKVDVQGTVSNRDGVGAKVQVLGKINGQSVWQYREIRSTTGNYSQGDPRAHFGLGDATTVEEIRVEWPSGAEQIMTGVAVNQILSVTELWWPEPTHDGWVDTGDWLGRLYVEHDPWIWCEDLNHWMYCPSEYITESGAWVYVTK